MIAGRRHVARFLSLALTECVTVTDRGRSDHQGLPQQHVSAHGSSLKGASRP